MERILIALFTELAHVEVALNNLEEADFDLNQVTIIVQDEKKKKLLKANGGPFKGVHPKKLVTALMKLQLPPHDAAIYHKTVENGGAFFGMQIEEPYKDAAKEILATCRAEYIVVL